MASVNSSSGAQSSVRTRTDGSGGTDLASARALRQATGNRCKSPTRFAANGEALARTSQFQSWTLIMVTWGKTARTVANKCLNKGALGETPARFSAPPPSRCLFRPPSV
jgi:hypothetical protein